mgnify:CR=1 FL=1
MLGWVLGLYLILWRMNWTHHSLRKWNLKWGKLLLLGIVLSLIVFWSGTWRKGHENHCLQLNIL